jgi:RNA polymerase sigma-70 factor (ECF subfamily)
MEDESLVKNFVARQANPCFELLYKRYSRKVFAKCISMLKDEVKAGDATQDIFMKIFTNLSKFNYKSKFSTWVYSITYNYCIDALRKQQRRGAIFSDELENAPDEAVPEVSDAEMAEIKIDILKKVLAEIPPGDRLLLEMKYKEGQQIKEIAALLNKSDSAIKMKLKRAKAKAQKIKSRLEQSNKI